MVMLKAISHDKSLVFHTFAGAIIGYLVLHPVTMLIYQFVFEIPLDAFGREVDNFWQSIFLSFDLPMLEMGFYFTLLGGCLGLGSGFYYRSISRKDRQLQRQEGELRRNVLSLIDDGESGKVEFKSSLRWDLKKECIGKEIEKSVLKTLAGFMNMKGGTLIIGVGDDGEITGLESDYCTLKKKNRDGFEQKIMQLISNCLGTDLCSRVHVMFHNIEGKEVCRVYTEPSPRPVYLQNGKDVRYYLRTGNSTRELNVEEAIQYISVRGKDFQ